MQQNNYQQQGRSQKGSMQQHSSQSITKHKVVLATGNAGKVAEMAGPLADFGMQIIAQSELGIVSAEETGLTFIENALLKARHASQLTGLPAIADDSGLVVDILNGAPGIYSARYAGDEGNFDKNIDKLLTALQDSPPAERSAYFYCALVYLRYPEDPTPLVCQGRWNGEIALRPAGVAGFGYDPVFYIPALGCTAAELPSEQKCAISHRGQALQQLFRALSDSAVDPA